LGWLCVGTSGTIHARTSPLRQTHSQTLVGRRGKGGEDVYVRRQPPNPPQYRLPAVCAVLSFVMPTNKSVGEMLYKTSCRCAPACSSLISPCVSLRFFSFLFSPAPLGMSSNYWPSPAVPSFFGFFFTGCWMTSWADDEALLLLNLKP
jgi:hypothetical protein